MRLLLGLALLSSGCDLLFQIDHLKEGIDASGPIDTEPHTIELVARGKIGANGTVQTLSLAFGADQPRLTDFTLAAVCYNHTNSAMVASIDDVHGHGLERIRTSFTTNEYAELWGGHVDGDLKLMLTLPADFPDIRAVSYRGVEPAIAPETVEGKLTGTAGRTVSAGPLNVAQGLHVVIAADCVQNQTTSLPDFVQEVDSNGNWISDTQVTGPVPITATATQQSNGEAVLVLAALQAAE